MQGDIYATKGIEYIIVIAYLLVLVGILRLLSPPRVARMFGMRSRGPVRPRPPRSWFAMPEGLHFHQGHAWAARDDGEIVTVGVDDFAQRLLGPVDAIHLPQVGTRLRLGERGWTLVVDDKPISMVAPVEGKVVAVNRAVVDSPEVLARSPYDDGWLLKVRVPRSGATWRNLLSGDLARAWMAQTVERLRRMPAGELGIVMPDGGEPVAGFVRLLDPEHWDQVAREFLLID
jgi:glycine cleavage system H lipoate-binding protein